MRRIVWLSLLTLLSALPAAAQTTGDMQQRQGLLLSAGGGQLTMVGTDGKQQTFAVGPTAIIRNNGKPAALEDLKKGSEVAVTLDSTGKVVAVSCMLPKQQRILAHSRGQFSHDDPRS